jgi:hypothetical protein
MDNATEAYFQRLVQDLTDDQVGRLSPEAQVSSGDLATLADAHRTGVTLEPTFDYLERAKELLRVGMLELTVLEMRQTVLLFQLQTAGFFKSRKLEAELRTNQTATGEMHSLLPQLLAALSDEFKLAQKLNDLSMLVSSASLVGYSSAMNDSEVEALIEAKRESVEALQNEYRGRRDALYADDKKLMLEYSEMKDTSLRHNMDAIRLGLQRAHSFV